MRTIRKSAVCEHMLIASTSPHTINRYPYHAQMRVWVYLVVLTLTLFNPLACLIHCHVMHQQHASPMTMYVCDMGTTMMATHQHDLQSVPPPTINGVESSSTDSFMACLKFESTRSKALLVFTTNNSSDLYDSKIFNWLFKEPIIFRFE